MDTPDVGFFFPFCCGRSLPMRATYITSSSSSEDSSSTSTSLTGVFLPFFLEDVFEDFLRADLAGDLDLDLELVEEDEDLFLPLLLISLVTADFFLRKEAVGFLRDAEFIGGRQLEQLIEEERRWG